MRRHNTHLLIPIAQLVALALYLAIGYLYVISGLAVPPPFLFLLWASWGALLVIVFRHRHDMRYLVGVPVSAAILWGAIVLGLAWIGTRLAGLEHARNASGGSTGDVS